MDFPIGTKVTIDRCLRCGKENIPGEVVSSNRIAIWHACVVNPNIEIIFNTDTAGNYDFEMSAENGRG